ncbi:MAG: hypothetical protein CFH01_00615 [Alphaproteobacteria bacterium MarineAlpha2_Bin1]|nr:MAG: hypothetical protein CFH01_00615 [Alphaproteobacteria bacterium MarineAlpha2_Bin1]
MLLSKIKFFCKELVTKFYYKFFKFVLILFFFSSCSNTDNLIKLSEIPPDEFSVVRKDPLEIPPNFNLRPPGKSKKTGSINSSEKAKDVLSDLISNKQEKIISNEYLTKGDVMLLENTGFKETKTNIREVLITENSLALQHKGRIEVLIEKLVGNESDANILDPEKEVRRNQEKLATGENFVKSQKPVIIRRIR